MNYNLCPEGQMRCYTVDERTGYLTGRKAGAMETNVQRIIADKIVEFTAEIRQHVEQRLDFLQRGVTVAEAVADIPDLHLRQAVQAGLLYAHALSLSDGLCNLGVLTRAQADELSLYLSKGLAPMSHLSGEQNPPLAPTFIEVAVWDQGEETIYPLPAIPRAGDTLVLQPLNPDLSIPEQMRQVEEVVLLARDVVPEPRRTYIRVFLAPLE